MAQQGNTGTPPAAGAPGNEGGNSNQGGQGAGEPNSPPPKRLIAGKYETMEDAVEQGIFGMEKAFHQTREDLARVARVVEQGFSQRNMDPRGGYAPIGTGGSPNYDAYGRGQPVDPDGIDPAAFIVNPGQVLRQREARLLSNVAQVVENVVSNAMVVNEFKRVNPDLVPHERIVRAFMNETDGTKGYAERLKDAAQMTREYLTNVRAANGGNTNPAPAGGNYVETPRGGNSANMSPLIPGQQMPNQMDEEEKELVEYINERNKDISARFGIKS